MKRRRRPLRINLERIVAEEPEPPIPAEQLEAPNQDADERTIQSTEGAEIPPNEDTEMPTDRGDEMPTDE